MVSIIMPTYNRAYIIERAIKSVLVQTYDDWELIIVDDASVDETKQVVDKYLCSKVRYYVNIENKGANASRNLGAGYAKGEVLAFLDSDNYWPEYRLELQMKIYEEHKNERCFFYGKVQITDGENMRMVPEKVLVGEELKKIELCENVVDTNTILIRKELFDEVGGFDANMPRLQDWELALRMIYHFQIIGIVSNVCFSFNEIQGNSIGRDDTKYARAMSVLYKKYMFQYLTEEEIIQNILSIICAEQPSESSRKELLSEICSAQPKLMWIVLQRLQNTLEKLQGKNEQFQTSYCMEKLLYKWHKNNLLSKEGTMFAGVFSEESMIKTIAIYGLGKLGELFYNEIKDLPVRVVFGIDRTKTKFENLQIRRPDEIFDSVDCIVVTVIKDCNQIKNDLEKKYPGKIKTIIEIVEDAYESE